jgi:hypothetical protein
VFGMGTGVAIQVCSPELPPASGSRHDGQYQLAAARVVFARANVARMKSPHPFAYRRGGLSRLADSGSRLAVWPRARRAHGSEKRINAVKRLAVSTGQLRRLPALHTRPIDLVVFQEPTSTRDRRPYLEEGFTLICLQRLSWPYVATQRCPERDNWHTRGTSLPILSY